MKLLIKVGLVLTICAFIINISEAQSLKKELDAIYGLDNKLYNGYLYNGNYGAKVKGHPFLYDEFSNGNLILQEKKFQDLQLNYDITNQLLILKFNDAFGAEKMIEVPFFKINEFEIKDDLFSVFANSDSSFQVYQIIGENKNQFWLKHYKKLELEYISQQYEYQFSRNYVQVLYKNDQGGLTEISNNKSLLQLIEKDDQQAVKKWLKAQKIKIHKSNSQEVKLLSQFLKQL